MWFWKAYVVCVHSFRSEVFKLWYVQGRNHGIDIGGGGGLNESPSPEFFLNFPQFYDILLGLSND